MPLIAIAFMLLLMAVGMVIDIGRLYAAQGKAQNAADAALLGAVATMSTTDLRTELIRLFNTNFPDHYMGSTVANIEVNQIASGVYEMTFDVSVPTVIMQLFGADATELHMVAQVTRGFEESRSKSLELALVLDNTGSMNGSEKIGKLITASLDLIEIIFGEQTSSNKIHVSVIPYDIVVNIGPGRSEWFQDGGAFGSNRTMYEYGMQLTTPQLSPSARGIIANRQWDHWCGPRPNYCRSAVTCPVPETCGTESNPRYLIAYSCPNVETGQPNTCYRWSCNACVPQTADCRTTSQAPYSWSWFDTCPGPASTYPGVNYSDISDCPPVATGNDAGCSSNLAERKFRLYWDNIPLVRTWSASDGNDGYMKTGLEQMLFASNDKANIRAKLENMRNAGSTRINVGLMWGWFTLSPKWQGIWDAGKPDLPADYSPSRLEKALVLMTDGKNIRIPSVNGGYTGDRLNDDRKTELLCNAIKAQGITIYTVGFGPTGEINEPLLRGCASVDAYYFHAPTADDLRTAFHRIADDILFNTLRLSK